MLYIHIPYCLGKCIYCDFYSAGNPDWVKYLKAAASELSERTDELRGDSLSSIYIGGGTPSLIPETPFSQFIKEIDTILKRNEIKKGPEMEFTLEVNPEDVSEEKIRIWQTLGINRISMGVQSLNDTELKLLKRRHDSRKALKALQMLKTYFDNISVDLIFGIPGQTKEILNSSISKILEFFPTHISAYALTYEEKTPLFVLREKGKIKECSEENYLILEELIRERLYMAGYEKYEISNYALPGYRSRHNSGYWSGKKYLGIGPSASSYDGSSIRRTNPSNLKSYIERFTSNKYSQTPFYHQENLTIEELIEERIFISLRTSQGIDLVKYSKDFGENSKKQLLQSASRWIKSEHMILSDHFLSLTTKGVAIADHIILSLV